ncbi:peptide transporter protein -like [Oryza sativa Japonica Group]|uniref:Os01g0235900 protein n=2 Tax=Oryza sativa subsp. japonica TaxID=39947 RepID=Q0JP88_ORYSJ|nr:uncharacterized protein LOC4327783 [Oryza sativa Japonica Group]KAB8080688.1 hypothetical protein EE612_001318 [Oryza sativa]KAF2949305.1 hypothetical protein DAI22_01g096000 [Oryza sativa Japonica Group]BAA92911.1 peptide transporter protein -like [Oryza sativa Japonica Group]BAF04440.1 Os01g0235900 [Oryza sativa Japonica Group]BAS71226.1 Os01g0235900 [Oryza sativa Japonica Group]|eukprot:NP_001042526.1 Os01g0235900 [Oryza sativa Japonica Group]
MGCAGSKDVTVADVYRPPPTSVSLFDISAIEEPWLIATGKKNDEEEEEEDEEEEEEEEEEEGKKPTTTVMPLPLLDKLDGYDLAPASWSEVSKALEDIKPALSSNTTTTENAKKKTKKKKKKQPAPPPQPPTTTTTVLPEPVKAIEAAAKKAAAAPSARGANEEVDRRPPPPELTGRRVVKDNPFLMRDRENKGNDGGAAAAAARWRRRDPFEGYPERRPPGASGGGVVLYTTTLRGVRRTFEDCERARKAVEACAEAVSAAGGSPVVVDERDVSLHGEYLRELRGLAGAGDAPPRLFVMGRYLGGADACAELAESGKLREMMRWARARGEACAAKDGRGCEGCGGARFVPCWECGGSCKVVAAGATAAAADVERCAKCNENGLMLCPICH